MQKELESFVTNDNIIKRVMYELDNEHRIPIINFFNRIVFKKYARYLQSKHLDIWKNYIQADNFFLNPKVWLKRPMINMNNKSDKKIEHNVLDLDRAADFIRKWLKSDCNRMYIVTGFYQELVYNSYMNNGDEKRRNKLIDGTNLKEFLRKGAVIVLCIFTKGDPLKSHYIVILPLSKNDFLAISTLDGALDPTFGVLPVY
jgi:hypothetical protein